MKNIILHNLQKRFNDFQTFLTKYKQQNDVITFIKAKVNNKITK